MGVSCGVAGKLMAVNSKGIGKSISFAYAGDHTCVSARFSAPARKNAVTPACTKRFGEGRHFGLPVRAPVGFRWVWIKDAVEL